MDNDPNNLYKHKDEREEDTILSIRVSPQTKRDFSKLCRSRGTTVSEVLRRFINRELSTPQPSQPEPQQSGEL